MNYQPWQYAETKILHDLFLDKFGKVWKYKSAFYKIKSGINATIQEEFELMTNDKWDFYHGELNFEFEDYLPALTLSSFCEFADEIQDKFIIPDSQKILMNIWLKSEIQETIAKELKHFALDNWSKPQKIINEVKKYL